MKVDTAITAVRVQQGRKLVIRVTGVTHPGTMKFLDGVAVIGGNRATRANFVVVAAATRTTWDDAASAYVRTVLEGTAYVEGTRVSEEDARRTAAKLTNGRVIRVVEG